VPLCADEHTIFALFLRGNVPTEIANSTGLEPIEVTADYERHPAGEFWENTALITLARKLRADLFHGPAFLIPWRRTPFKKIVTIHDLIAFRCPRNYPTLFQAYLKFVIRRSIKSADLVLADSHHTQRDIISVLGTDAGKIAVVHCGTSKPFRRLSESERTKARAELNLPQEYILYVSNLEPRKNHALLVRAFALVKQTLRLPHHLIFIGKKGGDYRDEIKRDYNDEVAKCITIVDYAPPERLALYYNCADLFVFPSLYEGFGLPLLEAMACGVPVIALGTSSVSEVTSDSAVLLPPDTDAESLASEIVSIVSSEHRRRALIDKGLRRVKMFTWDAAAQKLLALYRGIAEIG
jgi:glycosyltransferase involved in cell wall biosynthesis